MKRSRVLMASLLVLCATFGWFHRASAAPLDELVAAAKKEGILEFYAYSALTPKGAQALAEAFNKRYGLNIKVNYHPSQDMAKNAATVISWAIAGLPPEWDVMVVTDAHHGLLWQKKLHKTFDYSKVGVDAKLINYDNGTVSIANEIIQPAYNKNILPAKDAPKSWDDLLDPKWRGKLGVTTATHHLARLAVGAWGEEKASRYVKALAKQDLMLGRMGDAYTRLLLGEILVVFSLHDGFIQRAKREGAPIVHANIEPLISPSGEIGVLKGARHPYAGHLFSVFLTTPEAQNLWHEFMNQSSGLIPGTETYKELQGKKALFMTPDQVATVERLSKEYSKILGFER